MSDFVADLGRKILDEKYNLTREEAMKIGREIDGMAVSGVAMTGKRVPHQDRTREIIGVWSSLVAREAIKPVITMYES